MKGQPMNIIISHSSMVPIYEQITAQIKASVMDGNLAAGDLLPSVRSLSKELKISALTVQRAYDRLEEEGFVVTVHGKGSFIAATNQELMMEERRRDVEAGLSGNGHTERASVRTFRRRNPQSLRARSRRLTRPSRPARPPASAGIHAGYGHRFRSRSVADSREIVEE